MTQHEDHSSVPEPDKGHDEEVPQAAASGSEAEEASGPEPQSGDEELTVEDILSAEQSEAAAGASAAADATGSSSENTTGDDEEAGEADERENPYLEDLRRITAEYANYRKRTEENAELERQRAKASAISHLLGVLDDLDRAEAHGDLEEGSAFATIAQKIRATFERMGLEGFGEKGEAFDPLMHEAIAQVPVAGTEQATIMDVVERGYRLGDVEIRPAKVAVAVPADG